MPCTNLLTLPEELLVQHILARLDLPTLRSCSSTCRRLKHTITSSALLNYSIKLQKMSLIDNPAITYDEIPLNKRLEMLREYRERRGIRWKTSAGVLSGQRSHVGSIKGEAGVLYIAPFNGLDAQRLHWTSLPSKEDQAIEWNVFCPSNRSAIIVAHALSIEENDLLVFATWQQAQNAENALPLQIHLIQHSGQIPYPGLPSPILDICAFQRLIGHDDDRPLVNLAIHNTNLVVMVGHSSLHGTFDRDESTWAGHLSVWNWKTGEKKCEKLNIPDKNTGLVFLREDILLHACSMNPSLDIYHIPTSTPSMGDRELLLIERLALPGVNTECSSEPLFDLNLAFADNPTTVPSFTESSNPKVTRLFTSDDLSPILVLEATIEYRDSWSSFLLISHHHTLLDRADHALSRHKSKQDAAAKSVVRWKNWGPEATRIFWYNRQYLTSLDAPCGSRLFRQRGNFIEVYDFDRADTTNGGLEDSRTSHYPSLLFQDDDTAAIRSCFQDVEHTNLPFLYQNFEGSIDGFRIDDWDTMYVDQSRIVGLKNNERIDVLYIG